MLKSVLFDTSGSSDVADIASAARKLSDRRVLWVDSEHGSADEMAEVAKAFALSEPNARGTRTSIAGAAVRIQDDYIHVTVALPPEEGTTDEQDAELLDCYVGPNWLVTNHESPNPIIDEFRDLTTGAGEIGMLDAMSLLATLLELVVVCYSEAFEQIEEDLEDFDEKALQSADRDIEAAVARLVADRARVGLLRRVLAPHRRVFMTLSHTELDAVSTDTSARRFLHLAQQVGDTLNDARDAREAIVNSFDMLILRTEHRTNEIVKVLTLASILFLPGALVAGLMGMNVNIPANEFVTSFLFWGSLALIITIAVVTVILAKARNWI